eukprot:4929344-Ditylum_brightwellii.AAC.1
MLRGFESYFYKSIRTDPDWSEHYVDYAACKAKFKSYSERRHELQKLIRRKTELTEEDLSPLYRGSAQRLDVALTDTNANDYVKYEDAAETGNKPKKLNGKDALRRASAMERADFCDWLDKEIEKTTSFYSKEVLSLSECINKFDGLPPPVQKIQNDQTDKHDAKMGMALDYETLADEILELFAFVVVNTVTLRQLIIRYDAFVRTFDGIPLSN